MKKKKKRKNNNKHCKKYEKMMPKESKIRKTEKLITEFVAPLILH